MEHWDHATILFDKDKALGAAIESHTGQTIYYLKNNPTAENMAEYLIGEICPKLFEGSGLRCMRLTLHETPNCKVEASA